MTDSTTGRSPRSPEGAGAAHRRPTGHDVAELAGVSQSTVSLVFSGKTAGRVSAKVEERVRHAAARLGYRPHASASTLRAGRARTVGLLVPDVTNPFIGHVLRGAQRAGRADGVTVALIEPGPERTWQLTAMEALNAAAIDGMMLFGIEPPASTALGPIVLIEAVADGFTSALLDVRQGTAAAVGHLLELGHRRIAHLGTDLPPTTFKARASRWRRELDQAGIGAAESPEVLAGFSLQAARGAAHQILSLTPRPTALFCDDDLLAAGALMAAHDLRIAVPGELSIMGFAGTLLSEAATPQLSTVVAPAEELGAVALQTLLQTLDGRATTPRPLPMTLVPRASTAPPHRPPDR
ncbi:LacI family DNA-binding transcriptional regulator [Spirillospora sp. CA-128828]|uniref:LacI family DNA-binding transcriptional regulator n=1 Tax=Spirillospora sp. CA-128828 TaxID=3240033 RepID=UPI003D8F8546